MFQVEETALGSLRYAGRSKALVEDNVDPQKRGRVRVKHPLLGDLSVWVAYLTPPGVFTAPQIGDVVYIEADSGEYSHPVAWGNLTKNGGGAVPDTFLRATPTNRGMYTPNNHLFEMDDGQTSAKTDDGIRLTTSAGHKFHLIDDTAQTSITLADSKGNESKLDSLANVWTWTMAAGTNMTIDGSQDLLSMTTDSGDTVSISASDGIQMSTPADGGTTASFSSGAIDFTAAAGFSITADQSVAISATDAIEMTAKTGMTMSSDATYDITGKTGITMSTSGAGAVEISPAGVAIKGGSGELLTILEELLDALSQATYPGFGAPASNVAQYPLIKLKITGMKA